MAEKVGTLRTEGTGRMRVDEAHVRVQLRPELVKEEWKWRNPNRQVEMEQMAGQSVAPKFPASLTSIRTDHSITSGFSALIKRSTALIANVGRDDDGACGLGGCRCFIWMNAVLLFGIGSWILWIWLDVVLTLSEKKYLSEEVSPRWPVFSNLYAFSFCWLQPFLSAIWLPLSTYVFKRQFIRIYYILTPWLVLVPFGYILFYTFYVGNVSVPKMEAILRKHLEEFRDGEDTDMWNGVQAKFKCCGINENGWKDWTEAGDLVPQSCCKPHKGCPKSPNDENTYTEGCLSKIVDEYTTYGYTIIAALAISVVVSLLSVYSATKFYTFLQRELNPTYEMTWGQFLVECMCPCFIRCLKNHLTEIRYTGPVRTTEMALTQRAKRFGLPLGHIIYQHRRSMMEEVYVQPPPSPDHNASDIHNEV